MDRNPPHPIAAPEGTYDLADWPVDVQRTDASGDVDLAQIEYNLSLTPTERIQQNDRWAAFVSVVREAGRQYYASQAAS